MLKRLHQEKLKMLIKINFSSYQNKIIMKKIILFLLFINIIFCVKSQVLTKPNGDVIAKPNLKVVKTGANAKNGVTINSKILTNIQSLKTMGKSFPDIAKQLKVEKFSATQIYQSFKTTVPDYENITALCYAGFTLPQIIEAIKIDGKTAMECVDLLKNSTGCTFIRSYILSDTKRIYNLNLIDLVPIIQAKYSTDKKEIVNILIQTETTGIYNHREVIPIIKHYNYANNRTELCALFLGSRGFNTPNDLRQLDYIFPILRNVDFPIVDKDRDIASALISIEVQPINILSQFQNMIYRSNETKDAITLAKLAKFMNISRDETARFLKNYPAHPFTAAQILDALQAAYD